MLPRLTSGTALALTLLCGALACSDDSDDPTPALGGSGGSGGSSAAGAAGTAGTAGTGGGSAGAAGASNGGSAGNAGAAGTAGSAGAAGSGPIGDAGVGDAAVDVDSNFPVPDKLVALTFDDGPNPPFTNAVLDKLQTHGVPASFFLIGNQLDDGDAATLARAAALGATFENHSDDFNSLTGVPADQVTARVNATSDAIEARTGVRPQFFRAPNLATDATVFGAIDLPLAGGIVTGDFPGGNGGGAPTVNSVVAVVRSQIQDGSIILMHDVQPSLNPQVTPDALDIIIPELRQQGYEFVTLRELFVRRGIDPASRQDDVWNVVPPNP